MKLARSLSLALAVTALGAPSWAAQDDKHQSHHPAGTASAPASKAMPGKAGPDMARMEIQMMAMREMHDKMMAAKTPRADAQAHQACRHQEGEIAGRTSHRRSAIENIAACPGSTRAAAGFDP